MAPVRTGTPSGNWNSRAHLHSNRLGWIYYVEALISEIVAGPADGR